MPYKPGLHILSTFKSDDINLLATSAGCRPFFESLVKKHGLQKVGDVYHDFDGGGFTAVVCLTESHLSIHTWPEFGLATFDVFLSNYQKENDEKVRDIYQQVLDFFHGETTQLQEVKR
jgi:S-adenosylmethionine decarboxylase